MTGAFLGAVIVWLAYLPHWKETSDARETGRFLYSARDSAFAIESAD
jgi:glycerol uptake facilitator-like aquaporin